MKTADEIRHARFLLLLEEAGSVKAMADRLGVSSAQISQIKNRSAHSTSGKPRSIGDDQARRIEVAFSKPKGWMDSPLPEGPPDADHSLNLADITIPQFETGGAMGHGIVLHDQPGVIKQWRVTEEWLRRNVHRFTSARNLAIVTGFGPSMQPLFNPGDPLLIDRGVTKPDIDGIYFFRVGAEGFVKQLQRLPSPDGAIILRAKSYNPMYDPFDILGGMDFEVFGRVVKVWRGEEF
jgi:hypothetical protein